MDIGLDNGHLTTLNKGMVISLPNGEGYAAIQSGGRAACSGGGGSLVTHSAD